MALLLKNNTVFLHVPKTGGMWVTQLLYDCGLVKRRLMMRHTSIDGVLYHAYWGSGRKIIRELMLRKIRKYVNNNYYPNEDTFFFCFVRNPYSWYESWWCYMSGLGWNHWGNNRYKENWHPCVPLNGLGDDDFNKFIENVIRHAPGFLTNMYNYYTKTFCKWVGKQENIQKDTLNLLAKFDIDVNKEKVYELNQINKSSRPLCKINWDANLKKEIYYLEYPIFKRFGYEF